MDVCQAKRVFMVFATLFLDVLVKIHELLTSQEVWECLLWGYMIASLIGPLKPKHMLVNKKKLKSQTMDRYLYETKAIAHYLALISSLVPQTSLA